MIEIIKQSKIRIKEEQSRIRQEISEYLKTCDYKSSSKSFQQIDIKSLEELKQIYYGQGFYIILTDHKFQDNECEFEIENFKAIYRGHSYFVKHRVMSHLFNDDYNANLTKHKTNYTVCLKVEDGIEGININQKPYSDYSWKVIVHKMKESSVIIREQAEFAFDEIYKKPLKSREK